MVVRFSSRSEDALAWESSSRPRSPIQWVFGSGEASSSPSSTRRPPTRPWSCCCDGGGGARRWVSMLVWAAALAFCATARSHVWGPMSAATISAPWSFNGPAYRDEMFALDPHRRRPRRTAAEFIPQHVVHLAAFVALAWPPPARPPWPGRGAHELHGVLRRVAGPRRGAGGDLWLLGMAAVGDLPRGRLHHARRGAGRATAVAVTARIPTRGCAVRGDTWSSPPPASPRTGS